MKERERDRDKDRDRSRKDRDGHRRDRSKRSRYVNVEIFNMYTSSFHSSVNIKQTHIKLMSVNVIYTKQ